MDVKGIYTSDDDRVSKALHVLDRDGVLRASYSSDGNRVPKALHASDEDMC